MRPVINVEERNPITISAAQRVLAFLDLFEPIQDDLPVIRATMLGLIEMALCPSKHPRGKQAPKKKALPPPLFTEEDAARLGEHMNEEQRAVLFQSLRAQGYLPAPTETPDGGGLI